jgi:histone H3/H4
MEKPCSYELTLEQKFELSRWARAAKQMPREILEEIIVELAQQMMTTQNAAKCIMQERLGSL